MQFYWLEWKKKFRAFLQKEEKKLVFIILKDKNRSILRILIFSRNFMYTKHQRRSVTDCLKFHLHVDKNYTIFTC